MQFADIKNLDDEGLKSAYQEADRHTWNKKDIEAYEYERMRETDEKAEKMLVEENSQKKIAKNLISLGSENDFIVKATDLTLEQVEQLRNETNQ
jgi:RNA-splicing ligase RtcB